MRDLELGEEKSSMRHRGYTRTRRARNITGRFRRSIDEGDEEGRHILIGVRPEQTAVYSREFAQAAASLPPQWLLRKAEFDAKIDELY
jgi:hypothetical protein